MASIEGEPLDATSRPPSTAHPESGDERTPPFVFGLGPAPIDYTYGEGAHLRIRITVAVLAGLVHLILGAAWDWRMGMFIAALTPVSLFVVIPVSGRFPRAIDRFWFDLGTIAFGLILLDAPVAIPAWGALLMLFVVPFIGGRAAMLALAATSTVLAAVVLINAVWDPGMALSAVQQQIYMLCIFAVTVTFAVLLVLASGAATLARDEEIRRRRTAEDLLRQQVTVTDRRMQAMSEYSPVGLAMQDGAGKFLAVNRRLLEVYGVSEDDILDRGVAHLIDPAHRVEVEASVLQAARTGSSVNIEYRIHRNDGEERWVELTYVPLKNENGRVMGATSTVLDRTDEILARRESEIVSMAADSARGFLAVWRPDGRFVFMNQAVVDFFGVTGEWREKRVDELGMHASIGELPAGFLASIDTDATAEGEVEFVRFDGVRVPHSVAVTHVTDAIGEKLMVGIARDISEQRSVAEGLEDLLRSKDEFVASVSHELRTPLTAVVGLAREMSERIGSFSDAEITEFARLVAEQSIDVSAIVEDLLTSARMDAGTLRLTDESVDLEEAARRALDSVAATLAARVELVGGDVGAMGDTGRVRQIIRNLVTNAGRYGGEHIRMEIHVVDELAVVDVMDDGDSIAHDLLAHIFQPYGRGHDVDGVTDAVGLGLSVSRDLARLMNGDVTYHHDGDWSVFRLALPPEDRGGTR